MFVNFLNNLLKQLLLLTLGSALILMTLNHVVFSEKTSINPSVNAKVATELSTDTAQPETESSTQPATKKQAFVKRIVPTAKAINAQIKSTRAQLLAYQKTWNSTGALPETADVWLKTTATHFRMPDFDKTQAEDWAKLIKRVDIVPLSLVVAQSATESGWGTSRIAKQANNFFGYECFKKGCGVAPKKAAKQYYEYRKFASLKKAIHEYERNLNTHPGYKKLRDIRASLRNTHKPIKGTLLAAGLTRYSSRGQAYVAQVKTMITKNNWQPLDSAS